MSKIDNHPWVKGYADSHKRLLKEVKDHYNPDDPDVHEYRIRSEAKLHAARDLAKKYGSGHNMAHHGEGKKHGEK